jgi:hypothetical protein
MCSANSRQMGVLWPHVAGITIAAVCRREPGRHAHLYRLTQRPSTQAWPPLLCHKRAFPESPQFQFFILLRGWQILRVLEHEAPIWGDENRPRRGRLMSNDMSQRLAQE